MLRRTSWLLIAATSLVACEPITSPTGEPGPTYSLAGATPVVTGGGEYLLGGVLPTDFSVSAIAHADGSFSGSFRHRVAFDGLVVDIHGAVTCLAVDAALGRAWIGGVITANHSTDPDLQLDIHQPGEAAWFRVLDNDARAVDAPDRLTFLGFKGTAGIITSAEYCALKPWFNEGQPMTKGNLVVRGN